VVFSGGNLLIDCFAGTMDSKTRANETEPRYTRALSTVQALAEVTFSPVSTVHVIQIGARLTNYALQRRNTVALQQEPE